MDYTQFLNQLSDATLFDLYRLHSAIGKELDNPERIKAIKQRLKIGMPITYFYPPENRLVPASIQTIKQKKSDHLGS